MTKRNNRGGSRGAQLLDTSTLSELSSVLGRIFSVRLDVPEALKGAPNEKMVKQFCVGLLENPVNHTWWQAVKGLGVEERTSIQGSLFLARKALPVSPDPRQAEKHASLMSQPAADLSPEFLSFIEKEVRNLFPIGWDKGYQREVYSHTPTSSSCLEYSRSNGGARRWLADNGRDWFSDVCLGESQLPSEYNVKFACVETGGKTRGITVSSAWSQVLGPLHRTIYNQLCQYDWLLKGEARGKKFSSFQQKKGEVFVSGDYESATDNLSLEATQRILSIMLSNCRYVPQSIKTYAMRSLSATISYPGGRVVQQQRGQLMGNFLSFPLLCLQNYLAFRFAIPRPVPLRINGDDIVFRCTLPEFMKWKEMVGAAGLTLSAGKTLVNGAVFSLNSSFFRAGNRRVWEIPVVRLKSAVVLSENPLSASGFTRFIRGWKGEARRLLGGMWLRYRTSQIQTTGRSVEALGIPADNSQLHTAGLAVRESFYRGYRSHLKLREHPLPPVPQNGTAVLEWVRVSTRKLRATGFEKSKWLNQCREAFSDKVWQPWSGKSNTSWEEWWTDVKSSGQEHSWLSWKRTTKRVHKMGFRINLILRAPAHRVVEKTTWIPKYECQYRISSFRGGVGV